MLISQIQNWKQVDGEKTDSLKSTASVISYFKDNYKTEAC